MIKPEINICWFRRDLRLKDHAALSAASKEDIPLLPLFIFDPEILDELEKGDARVNFIHDQLAGLNEELLTGSSSFKVIHSPVMEAWKKILDEFKVRKVFFNRDYEPYARERDGQVEKLLRSHGVKVESFKDQVVFEGSEVLKGDGNPYTVYTPYKNKWLDQFAPDVVAEKKLAQNVIFHKEQFPFPKLEDLGFKKSGIKVRAFELDSIEEYEKVRDLPALDATSFLSPHLRFGTISIREVIRRVDRRSKTFLSELIWREFFMQILLHFPRVIHENFKRKYDGIQWRNDAVEFERWCKGETGYPMVDAGMRQLNQTGTMHNRVRMITAGFLCKHLLIDWRWGEAYFARKLLDYELSSNNGNWQWAAGTGCDAAPYFRVFNPTTQLERFDPTLQYVRKWIPEFDRLDYPRPMVEHKSARERAIREYKKGLERS